MTDVVTAQARVAYLDRRGVRIFVDCPSCANRATCLTSSAYLAPTNPLGRATCGCGCVFDVDIDRDEVARVEASRMTTDTKTMQAWGA